MDGQRDIVILCMEARRRGMSYGKLVAELTRAEETVLLERGRAELKAKKPRRKKGAT